MQNAMKPQSPLQSKGLFSKQSTKYFFIGLLFSAPWIIGFLCFQLYPLCSAIYYSFTDFNIFQKPNWIGLKNYIDIFNDKSFYISVKNTAYMAFVGLPIGLVTALALAMLLNTNVRGMSFWRTIFYIPSVTPVVASAMVFVATFNPRGLVNYILSFIGISGPNWISDPSFTKPMLVIMDSWRCGSSMIIFLAALKAVPQSFYEAAEMDGAGAWRRFRSITVPCISPTILFLVVMGIIQSFQYFSQAYVLAQITNSTSQFAGGPDKSLLFLSSYLYQNGFTFLKMGYACALAVIMFIVIVLLTTVVFKTMGRSVNYDLD